MKQTTFKGKVVTYEDVVRQMVRFDKDHREGFSKWGTFAVRHGENLYPPKQVLSMATGFSVDEFSGGDYTNRHFLELGFEVVNSVPMAENLKEIEEAVETSLSLERDLENFLVTNLSHLEPGLILFKENEKFGKQFDAGPAGRIDVLCIDQHRSLVVLELKAGEADEKVCAQVLRYMGWVQENLAAGRHVRGMIVANDFSEKLKYAVKPVPTIALKKYEVSFRFENVA
jgi:Endonuclease NucS